MTANIWVIADARDPDGHLRYWSAGGLSLGGATYRWLGLPDRVTGTVCTFPSKVAATTAYRAKFGSLPRGHKAVQLTAEQVALLSPPGGNTKPLPAKVAAALEKAKAAGNKNTTGAENVAQAPAEAVAPGSDERPAAAVTGEAAEPATTETDAKPTRPRSPKLEERRAWSKQLEAERRATEVDVAKPAGAAPYQVMPDLGPEDVEQLRESIRARGVLMPILVDEDGVVIDGHHRAHIAAELGVECPREVRPGLTETEKRSLAYELNSARRQLSREQKRGLVADSLKADPQLSDREHARRVGVSPTTVGAVRAKLEQTGDVSKLDTRTDSAGRKQPASKSEPSAGPIEEPEPAAAADTTEQAPVDDDHDDVGPIAEPADTGPAPVVDERGPSDEPVDDERRPADEPVDDERRPGDEPVDTMLLARMLAADMDRLTEQLESLFTNLDDNEADRVEALFDEPYRRLRCAMDGTEYTTTTTTTEEDE